MAIPENAILFYRLKDEHGYMSNFARYKVECFGRVWLTSEHAYQAQKYSGTSEADYEAVAVAETPAACAAVGRDTTRSLRPDWDRVKDDVMRFVVMHKFLQNAEIQSRLLSTGNRPIFEYDTRRNDTYWAINEQGVGRNQLGVTIMEVRDIIRDNIEFQAMNEGNITSPVDMYLASLRF